MRKIKPQLMFREVSCTFNPETGKFRHIWAAKPFNPKGTIIDRCTGKPMDTHNFICRIVDDEDWLEITQQTRSKHGRRYTLASSERFGETQKRLIRWFERNFELDPEFAATGIA